ncbi:MAG: hypothetical protein LPJ94_07320 [Thauera sp.]|uniref:hypothetical protein n=1 Tax=Thauera sp. JM12B12 TaxID=3142262 RepID=UPI0029C11E6B|nr:hypothetical protein [Thauera sp.]
MSPAEHTTAAAHAHAHAHGHAHGEGHDHAHVHAEPPRAAAERAPARLRPFPARSLLGASLPARLGVAALALVLLWTAVLWALR